MLRCGPNLAAACRWTRRTHTTHVQKNIAPRRGLPPHHRTPRIVFDPGVATRTRPTRNTSSHCRIGDMPVIELIVHDAVPGGTVAMVTASDSARFIKADEVVMGAHHGAHYRPTHLRRRATTRRFCATPDVEIGYERGRTGVSFLQRRRRVDHWPAPAYPKPNPFSPAMKVRACAHSSTAATNMREPGGAICW